MNEEQELRKLHEDTVNNLYSMFQEGAIDEAQFNDLKANADNELSQYLAHFSAPQQQTANFSSNYEEEVAMLVEGEQLKTQFGAAILELGAEAGYESVDDLAEDLAAMLGNDIDQINAVLVGDAVPNEDFIDAIIQVFELDDEDAEDLIMSAQEAWEDFEYALGGEEEEMTEDYSQYQRPQAQFNSLSYVGNSDGKVQELEQKLAQFESRDALKDLLTERVQKVENLVRDFHMPPAVAESVIGNFEMSANDRIAAFSATAEANNVSLESEIHATDKVIDIFENLRLGDTGLFQQYVGQEEAEFSQYEQAADLAEAEATLAAYKMNNK
jgi:hypothetical protein